MLIIQISIVRSLIIQMIDHLNTRQIFNNVYETYLEMILKYKLIYTLLRCNDHPYLIIILKKFQKKERS